MAPATAARGDAGGAAVADGAASSTITSPAGTDQRTKGA
jgi:hypothetical protein